MSKKKKVIIAITSFALVNLLIIGIAVTSKIKEIQSMPKCVNAATEQQVRYILNMPTGDIGPYLFTDQVRYVTQAFGQSQSVSTNEEGLYAFGHGTYDTPPPPEEYMDEKFLEFSLWLYTYRTGEILAIEEIEKLVTEGNIEKKAEIDAYYDWYYTTGEGGDAIKTYKGDYHRNFRDLTLEEQQAFVQASDAYENEPGKDFSDLTLEQQQALMQDYIEEPVVDEQEK